MTTSEIRRFFSKPCPVIKNLFPPPPIRSWESLVDVVAGSHPVRGYCCAWCILSGINSNELPTIVSLTKCKLSGTDLLRRSGTFSRLSQKSVLSPR